MGGRIPNTVPREFSEIVFSIEHATDEDPPKHRCGRCANPWQFGNPDCPNARRPGA
jgi:hypothetical protein